MEIVKRNGTARALVATAVLALAFAGCEEVPVPTTVAITPGSATLNAIGATKGFTAVVRDQNGMAMSGVAVSWSSSDPAVFTVGGSGSAATVTAAGNGTGTLTATAGAANATASVEVEQTPARVVIVSGDGQEGPQGATLPDPLVVRVDDQGGTAAPDVQVTFTPGSESGTVSEGTVVTNPAGMASTTWTLGNAGAQSVSVVAGAASATFTARAVSDDPIPDLELTGMTLSSNAPGELETIDIVAEVTNIGDAATPATFSVRLSADGDALETVEVGGLEPDESATVELTAGPFDDGSHEIELMADPDGEIDEWREDNNSASRSIEVLKQEAIELDTPITVSSSTVNEVQLFRFENDDPSDDALNVRLSGGSGDADLFVHYGERPGHHYRYRCLSGNPESDEFCQLVPTRAGVYHIAVHAYTAFGPSTLEVTVGGEDVESYDIDLVFLDNGTASQDSVIMQSAGRWEEVIGLGADDFDYSQNPAPAGTCGPGSPGASDVVDDIRIYVTIDSIDGGGGSGGNIIGQAAPCSWRIIVFEDPETGLRDTINHQVIRGFVILDEYDVDQMENQGVLSAVVTHEIAHVLGFGTLWGVHDRLRNPSVPGRPNTDTHFDGPLTIAAFDAAGGTGYTGGKVPVENSAVPGSADGHWRESVFEGELLTPFLSGGTQPLSAVTIESLYEIGFEVNLSEAEAFTLPMGLVAGAPAGPVIHLGNDIARIPMRGLDREGRVVKVIYPGER